jgi:hypothetical protein
MNKIKMNIQRVVQYMKIYMENWTRVDMIMKSCRKYINSMEVCI